MLSLLLRVVGDIIRIIDILSVLYLTAVHYDSILCLTTVIKPAQRLCHCFHTSAALTPPGHVWHT